MIDVNYLFFNNATNNSATPRTNLNLNSILSAISAAERTTNQSMLIIDFDEHKILYRSNNMIYLDEAIPTDFKRNCPNPYWSLVSDSTLEKLVSIKDGYSDLSYNQMSTQEYASHICILEYPISIRNHDFIINQTFTPLYLRPDGITGIGLFTFRPSAKREMGCMIIGNNGNRWTFDFKEKHFNKFNLGAHLSITEKAILQRARRGMSNTEIAADLFITESTVKTHKLRIFKKLNVSTISEALVIVGNYHLL